LKRAIPDPEGSTADETPDPRQCDSIVREAEKIVADKPCAPRHRRRPGRSKDDSEGKMVT
jgi:hypothetical protein